MPTLKIIDESEIDPALKKAGDILNNNKQSLPLEITIQNISKSRDMEKKYHAMIGDIAKTVKLPSGTFTPESWKTMLVFDYEKELLSMGIKLRKPGYYVLSLDGQDRIYNRASTKDYSTAEAADFIEFLMKTGTEYGAKFTDRSIKIYESYREAQQPVRQERKKNDSTYSSVPSASEFKNKG